MKRLNHKWTWAISLVGLALLLSGCEKFPGSSRFIRFTAVTGDHVGTRVKYSGVVDNGYERIDWVAGDQIRIYSDNATHGSDNYFDYTVRADGTADGRKSTSEIGYGSSTTEAGLEWGEDQLTYTFWGVCPVPPSTASFTTTNNKLTGLDIPSAQTVSKTSESGAVHITYAPSMSKSWLLAKKAGVNEGQSEELTLLFYPAFTAFEITIKGLESTNLLVKSFTLSSASTAISGTFDATIAETASSAVYDNFFAESAATGKKVTVSFGSGETINDQTDLTFTVFTLPRTLNDLSIEFVFEIDGVDVTRKLDLKKEVNSVMTFIPFNACSKHKITGLALPSGGLQLSSVVVNDWTKDTDDYDYRSAVTATLQCYAGESYRRYTANSKDYIAVSYGYRNDSGEVIITDDPAEYQHTENTALRSAFSPILELDTTSDAGNVLQLQLDNPNFKFIQYGNLSDNPQNGIDLSDPDHSRTDHLDIVSGAGVRTFFSVVPVRQFTTDAAASEKTCRVTLLSVSPGTLHEVPFNLMANGTQSLPGEGVNELKYFYIGPAVYGTTGTLVTP